MNRFDVFEHPEHGREAVKDGFSFPAFFFKWIWAFDKGLPGRGLLFIALSLLAWFPDALLGIEPLPILRELTEFSLSFWVGREGNEWRRTALTAKGYRWLGTVEAASPKAALAAWSSREAEGELAPGQIEKVE